VRLLSARLSARRRHPLAGLVVLALGLLLAGGVYTSLAPEPATATSSEQSLIEDGRKLFLVGCASCHGQNGEGIVTSNGNIQGPPLIGVGAAAVDFQVGTGRMPMAQTGAQAPRKDPQYDEEQVEALAAFVASLGPGPAIPDPEDYDYTQASEEGVVRGGELWRTNCTACHNFNASGGALPNGKYAAGLVGVEARHMYEAMLTGPQQMPVFGDDVMTPEDKRDIIAYVKALEENPNPGGLALGSLGPVSEGLFGWVVGIGALVAVTVWMTAHGVRSKK
jgi:ubiquinol-cytochrome c reductase cytochrome c subunit